MSYRISHFESPLISNPVVPGVYVMIIELTDYFGKKQVLKKDITIIP